MAFQDFLLYFITISSSSFSLKIKIHHHAFDCISVTANNSTTDKLQRT